MVVDPGVVQVAAATRPVEETDDEAGVIARFRIEPILLLEDLQRAGLQRTLVPVIERPLVHPLVLGVLDFSTVLSSFIQSTFHSG